MGKDTVESLGNQHTNNASPKPSWTPCASGTLDCCFWRSALPAQQASWQLSRLSLAAITLQHSTSLDDDRVLRRTSVLTVSARRSVQWSAQLTIDTNLNPFVKSKLGFKTCGFSRCCLAASLYFLKALCCKSTLEQKHGINIYVFQQSLNMFDEKCHYD